MCEKVYGIWNSITKRFVYGIKAPSKRAAEDKLRHINPGGWRAWRYEAKEIPAGFKNPKNPIQY